MKRKDGIVETDMIYGTKWMEEEMTSFAAMALLDLDDTELFVWKTWDESRDIGYLSGGGRGRKLYAIFSMESKFTAVAKWKEDQMDVPCNGFKKEKAVFAV